MKKALFVYLALCLPLIFAMPVMAQEDDPLDDRTEAEKEADRAADAYWNEIKEDERKGLYGGIYVGALLSAKNSASLYDGYGFDLDGNRNNFENSWLYRQINDFYGNPFAAGGDQIAQELNVSPNEWAFDDESYMPFNLKYNIAYAIGLQGRYIFDRQNALLFNLNFSRLTVNGLFNIRLLTTQPIDPTNPGAPNFTGNLREFGIRGEEQRVGLQLGYQRILGQKEMFNWVIEAGVDVTFAKFDGNQAQINNLLIDLTQFFNTLGGLNQQARNLTGASVGVFGGFGGQIETGGKWTVQLLYNPLFQKIALGDNTAYGLHHSLGLRAIYNI
jgi:hypothetical protein